MFIVEKVPDWRWQTRLNPRRAPISTTEANEANFSKTFGLSSGMIQFGAWFLVVGVYCLVFIAPSYSGRSIVRKFAPSKDCRVEEGTRNMITDKLTREKKIDSVLMQHQTAEGPMWFVCHDHRQLPSSYIKKQSFIRSSIDNLYINLKYSPCLLYWPAPDMHACFTAHFYSEINTFSTWWKWDIWNAQYKNNRVLCATVVLIIQSCCQQLLRNNNQHFGLDRKPLSLS